MKIIMTMTMTMEVMMTAITAKTHTTFFSRWLMVVLAVVVVVMMMMV